MTWVSTAASKPSGLPEVTVSIDWAKPVRTVDPKSYGVNCPQCLDPNWTGNAAFLDALGAVTAGGKPLIRLSGWGMVTRQSNSYNQCWLNADGTWNAPKIKSTLTPLVKLGYKLMINILAGPGGEGDIKDPGAFASFCAALVRIVNRDNCFGVKYWEIPNEGESRIPVVQMATLVSSASRAMKAVDPTILVGGPATAGVQTDYIVQVVQRCASDTDFVSVHTYGGDGTQADEVSFASARRTGEEIRELRMRLAGLGTGKYLPIFLDEYNIGWDFTPKIRNNSGAVYFALIQGGVVDAGGDVSAVWDMSPRHDMSIVSDDCTLYPSANLFSLMNQYFYGKRVSTATSDPATVYVYAVESGPTRSIVISNTKDSEQRVGITFQGWKPKQVTEYRISSQGYSGPGRVQWRCLRRSGLTLAAKSVTLFVCR